MLQEVDLVEDISQWMTTISLSATGRSGSRLPSGLNRGYGSDPRLLEHTTPTSSRGASPARSHDSPSASQSDIRQGPKGSRLQAPQVC